MDDNQFTIETEQEVDGRWIAEIIELPGVMTYGRTESEAVTNVMTLATQTLNADSHRPPSGK